MKNLHLLPTDKPSRLGLCNNQLVFLQKHQNILVGHKDYPTTNQNIYITSDEEIKVGDWFYVKTSNIYGGNIVAKCLRFGENCWSEHILTDVTDERGYHPSHCVKIILTTDKDLIKNGVQAIDDEFLQWFVKNPSCENVEVFYQLHKDEPLYKIIIPKEEPKQELEEEVECNNCGNIMSLTDDKSIYVCYNSECTSCYEEEPKQETLEEAAQKIITNMGWDWYNTESSAKRVAEYCARQQKERMYSEEDLKEAFKGGGKMSWTDINQETQEPYYYDFNEWFEQFKKK